MEKDDCECEDTPLIVYCKKCNSICIIANKNERIELTLKNKKKLNEILKKEMKDNYNFFIEREFYL